MRRTSHANSLKINSFDRIIHEFIVLFCFIATRIPQANKTERTGVQQKKRQKS
jgi:hypothetical protein